MLKFERGLENLAVSAEDQHFVARQLGRAPRGLDAIQVRRNNGKPAVIRVASLVGGKPFPTLFWLVDPQLHYEISQLEAAGVIAKLQKQIDECEELQRQIAGDNRRYIDLRRQFVSAEIASELTSLGYEQELDKKGVGGLSSFLRVRCIHTWFAAHLVTPNVVGRLLLKLEM